MSRAHAERVADGAADGRLPIVIGVAGHRHLRTADLPDHRRCVAQLLGQLRRRYPTTPLRVLSALAEGADQLVAEVALEHGCELFVPLPMPAEEYESDFPESVAQFRAIMQRLRPEQILLVPETGRHLTEAPAQAPARPDREQRYSEVGAFIAQHCHLLLALWDGEPGSGAGTGTAAVVHFKLEGSAGSVASQGMRPRALDPDDSGPVYHVHALRAGDVHGTLRPAVWMFPPDDGEQRFHRICARLERFNAEPARARLEAQIGAAAASLLPDIAARPLGDRVLATAFAYADRLARHYQRLTHSVMRLTLLLAAALALIFELYAEMLPSRWLPVAYLASFASLTGVLLWQRRLDVQGRYLDYRALAEGLRVQFYWHLAGLPDSASSSYLRKQLDELRWIREALRATSTTPRLTVARPELALRYWVQDQAHYYAEHTTLQKRRIHAIEHWSGLCMAVGLLAAASMVIFWHPLTRAQRWQHWAVLIMGFAPIGAALWEAYGERFGLRTQANQYARFAGIFRRAHRFVQRLEHEPHLPARRAAELELIRELGREALMENGDWVLLLRDRPIVLPKG